MLRLQWCALHAAPAADPPTMVARRATAIKGPACACWTIAVKRTAPTRVWKRRGMVMESQRLAKDRCWDFCETEDCD